MRATVLIVDDEVQLVRHLEHILRTEGFKVTGAYDAAGALKAAATVFPDVVLLDLKLPDGDGTTVMGHMRMLVPSARYIIMTAHGSIRSAVEATRKGASDYLTKPFEPEELILSVNQTLTNSLKDEEIRFRREADRPRYDQRVTEELLPTGADGYPSPAMQKTLGNALHASKMDSNVLLLGESGSGKDYLARFIHDNSKRYVGPFFAVNCAAVASELAESELFGHEPGAFTGARGRKRGLLELAEGGTLLLNEIGELPLPLQAKLLTFLDSRTFTRVGGETSVRVNARLIAATNRDLQKEISGGKFRSDLFYRLNVLSITIPPLRERLEDLPVLVQEILARLATEMQLPRLPLPDQASMNELASYDWPGNVRELRNVLERAVMLSHGTSINTGSITLESISKDWSYAVKFPGNESFHDVVNDLKRSLIVEALRRAGGARQQAANILGISRHSLAHQIRALRIDE